MSYGIENRVGRLEAVHGRADSWDAVMKSLSDDDLRLTIDFLRNRLDELRQAATASEEPALEPSVLTGEVLRNLVARARTWSDAGRGRSIGGRERC